MIPLAWRNLIRRPLRTGLALGGLAVAMAVLACLSAFGLGYRQTLGAELNRMGMQLMLVPLGCPFEAAAQVLKGRGLENSLPEAALARAREDPAVAVAAPLLMAAVPRPREGRTDLWVGLDESALALKPWWRARAGQPWFQDEQSVILGAEAAAIELREPGDRFHSPETGRDFVVAGVLSRSGTSDDSLFFVPLKTAQAMFTQSGRLTAIAMRLRDPTQLPDAARRLQSIPGAQVVTLTEMMGTFLNLVGAARTLLRAIALVALTAGALGMFNTLLAAVVERAAELGLMRALGASRTRIFTLITIESLGLAGAGSVAGLVMAGAIGPGIEQVVRRFVPLASAQPLLSLSPGIVIQSLGIALGVGAVAGLYPAWRACRMPPALAVKWE